MSSFLCFLCHNTVECDTPEDIREKYREIVGMHLCPDSQLCYVCCHMLNKLWLFKSGCLKRSLEYPVLFREKGTINLHTTDIDTHTLCNDVTCLQYNENQSNYFIYNEEYASHSTESNRYVKFEDNDATDKELFNHINDDHNDVMLYNNDNVSDSNIDESNCDEIALVHDVNDVEGVVNGDTINDDVLNDNNEVKDEENVDIDAKSPAQKKLKKSKKKRFKKMIVSLEDQKLELEANRRCKKYLDAEFKCYSCALSFLFKDSYQAHMMRHEESNGEYQCATCTLRFANPAVLRSHLASHAERYKCTKCGDTVRVRQRQAHARNCHGTIGEPVACHLCGNLFRDANGRQQHLKRMHFSKTSSRTYSCSVCGKTYNNQAAVRTHMIKHIHRKFKCDLCDATFSSPYTLNQHKTKHAVSGSNPEQHYCETCGVGYSSRKSLLAHRRNALNHQQRSHECPVCGRACLNSRALDSHIAAVHSETKPFTCPTCPAAYTSRKSLVRHIGSHVRKYEPRVVICHLCGCHFKGQSKLNRHLREVCEKDRLEAELTSYYEHQENV